jgi:ABC-type lipoprotein export system ATPase subunit
MLQLQNVTKTYRTTNGPLHAVCDLSLTIQKHEAVAVRGSSGCGKTTLLLLAGSLLRPSTGSVLIDGVDPYGLSADRRSSFRARNIGFVFQQFHLVPYLNVRQNILTANLPQPRPDAERRADELMERFGLQTRAGHVPAELSVGEQQRVALARAVFHDPPLLLADEPTGNLDPENAANVLEAMREYASAGAAVLIVTHAPDAADWAQRVIAMDCGRLAGTAA